MSLRLKLSLIILAIGGAFVTVALVFLNVGLFSSFRALQHEAVFQEAERAEEDLNKGAQHLGVLATDWAVWDDTYAFIEDRNEAYSDSNLSAAAHPTSLLDLLGIADLDGRWVHLGVYDRFDAEPFEAEGFPMAGLAADDPIWPEDASGARVGLMRYGDQAWIMSAHYVLPSSGEGEPRGLIVMGRRILPEDAASLSDHAGAEVTLSPYRASAEREPVPVSWPQTRIVDRDHAEATVLLADLEGRPAMELLVRVEAEILRSGRMALDSMAVSNIGAIVCISLVLLVLIRRFIVTRVLRLGRGLEAIRGDGDLSRRVWVRGADEIAQLGASVNALLAKLEQRTAALNEALTVAEDAAEARSRFLARMSHEIRTPISGILGLLELLRDASATDAVAREQYIETIEDSATSLLSLLNDVLDLSKLEADRLEIVPSPTQMDDFVERLVRSLQPLARAKELSLSAEVDARIEVAVMVDAARLRQVLTNLIGNALKFTAVGAVRLDVSLDGRDEASLRLGFAVRDTGPGIAPEDQARLFDDYFQVEGTQFQGTGLGLAISQQLVALMGGRIEVRSKPGEGATFTFALELPVFDPARHSGVVGRVSTDREPTLAGMRVMVVDDDPVNRMVAEKVLTKVGAAVTTACDGVEALDAFAAAAPDVVFIDSRMPRMDGMATTRALRAMDESGARVPVIAMSASVLKGDREAWAEAGADEFVSKPVDYTNLCWLARRLASGRPRAGADGASPREAAEAASAMLVPVTAREPMRTPPERLGAVSALNLEEAVERYGDLETVAEVVEVLLESAARRVERIRAGAEVGDLGVVRAEAHTIKGSAAMISAARVAEAAADLEIVAAASGEAPLTGTILNLQRALAELRGEWDRMTADGGAPEAQRQVRRAGGTDSASFSAV
jgi:signal transduction histidine kinase/CheY-like chemotaxis protein